jgi:hypothetical protein
VYHPRGYEDGTIRDGVRYLRTVVTKRGLCQGGGVDSRLGMDLFLLINVQTGSGAHPASCSMCTGDKAKREVNPFQSNFSANRILPSSYLFWAVKSLVDYV